MELGLGILPENRKISVAGILTREDGTPRCAVSDSDPRPEERAQVVLTTGAAGIKESPHGAAVLTLANLARREQH